MTPAARVQAALELCARIEAEKIGADAVIEGYFRSRRYAGAKDRRAVADRVYDLLRRRARSTGGSPKPETIIRRQISAGRG